MRLFIAEKPELGRAIAEALGGGSPKKGHIVCGQDTVTWCFGHMLTLFDPEDYDQKYKKWSFTDLPLSFVPWKKKPLDKSKEQLAIIKDLIANAETVVNAGDPDPEGQLLVDELLEYFKCRKPVKRVLINDNNTALVQKAIKSMSDIGKNIGTDNNLVTAANPEIKSRAFDSSKVSAHHAIIPTIATPDMAKLTKDEAQIYNVIAEYYLMQFLPNYKYEQTKIAIVEEMRREDSVEQRLGNAEEIPLYGAVFYADEAEALGAFTETALTPEEAEDAMLDNDRAAE